MIRSLNELRKKWIDFGEHIEEQKLMLLDFWMNPPEPLSNVQPLVKMLLSIPASSAASESAASVLGRINPPSLLEA